MILQVVVSKQVVCLHLPYKSTIHVGKYTVNPMDPTVDASRNPASNHRLDGAKTL